jgi:hypothetical protein
LKEWIVDAFLVSLIVFGTSFLSTFINYWNWFIIDIFGWFPLKNLKVN